MPGLKGAFKADQASLSSLKRLSAQVLSFEGTALRNADVVLQQSEKVDRTGVPAINRWLLAGKKSLAGDVGVAQLDVAVKTLTNEYAKISASATAAGQGGSLKDREESPSLLNDAATPEQVKRVIEIMKKDMQNRRIAMEEEQANIQKKMKIGATPEISTDTGFDAEKEKRYQEWKAKQK